MPRITEGQFALGGLFAGFVWIFVVLPLLYYPGREAPRNPERAVQGPQQSQDIRDEPPAFVALKLFTATGRNEIAAYCASAPQQQPHKWAHDYICDVKITDVFTAAFNGLLVAVTVGLIFIGYLTIRKMRDTEERQLRAYVFASPTSLNRPAAYMPGSMGSLNWRFSITFTNSGQTPAYEFQQYTASDVMDIPTSEDKFVIVPQGARSQAVLPSGENVSTTISQPVSAADFAAIQSGQKIFYVFGEIRYIDAFRRRWLVKFRFMHGMNQGTNDLVYCPAGNEEYRDT
jgi:hypothetical protein